MTPNRIMDAIRRRVLRLRVNLRRKAATDNELGAIRLGNVLLRPGTSDADVFYDAFVLRYHIPPPNLLPRNILDLGSNVGLTLVHFAMEYPEAQIIGVEMDHSNFLMCQSNIRHYVPRCRVIEGAVWAEDGEIMYGGKEEWGFRIGGGEVKARAYSMLSLLEQCGADTVDFVKMDIEGAEKEVLAAATTWASRVRCLKVEVHQPYTVEECFCDLQKAGYSCSTDSVHPSCVLAQKALNG